MTSFEPAASYLVLTRVEVSTQGRGQRRHGHHGGGRGRARRGDARYILLDALRDGPKHGYEIQHEVNFLQEELEHLNRIVWSGLHTPIAQGQQETIRRVRTAVEECKNKIREIITAGITTEQTP